MTLREKLETLTQTCKTMVHVDEVVAKYGGVAGLMAETEAPSPAHLNYELGVIKNRLSRSRKSRFQDEEV